MSIPPLFAAATLALMLLAGCSAESGPTLSAPEAFAQARAGKLTLIDIRRPDEWRQTGVAAGALRINMVHPQGVAGFVREVGAALDGRRDAPIALICRTGNRTTRMQKALQDAGFTNVYHIPEGMAGSPAGPGWIARDLPVDPCRAC